MQKNIKTFCTQILGILNANNEKTWSDVFEYLLEDLKIKDSREMAREILKIYQGMGSFNDLILYKNDAICFEANVTLNELRQELFKEVKRVETS